MSMGRASGDPTAARPNAVAVARRLERRWSQRRLATEFQIIGRRLGIAVPDNVETIIKQISRVERGLTLIPDDLYLRVWCAALGTDAAELFGHLDAPVVTMGDRSTFEVTSHKFVPVHVGCQAVSALTGGITTSSGPWLECRRRTLHHPSGRADLYVWPFGSVVMHVSEKLRFSTVAELAVWRRRSYPESRRWVDEQVRTLCGHVATSPYVLSLYWLERPKWVGDQLDVAMRLLAMPSVLLDRDDGAPADEERMLAGAHVVERTLLADHTVDRPDLVGFGARGVSIGYASWSGVAYHPVTERRALCVADIVACELVVQAVWCYTHEILRQVEAAQDPVVPAAYGRRFLRAVRSRLISPRPLESGQHNSMRQAVMASSGLIRQLDSAMDSLRESEAAK